MSVRTFQVAALAAAFYEVVVEMENGATRTFHYGRATSYGVGDRVKIVDKKLVRR